MGRWRGLQIFALAFLFRLQSQLLGWGVDGALSALLGLALVAAFLFAAWSDNYMDGVGPERRWWGARASRRC